jgi:hypothetical protein
MSRQRLTCNVLHAALKAANPQHKTQARRASLRQKYLKKYLVDSPRMTHMLAASTSAAASSPVQPRSIEPQVYFEGDNSKSVKNKGKKKWLFLR